MARKGNVDNLRGAYSPEEARENGRKGGIASGESKRQKKAFTEIASLLLSAQVKDPCSKGQLKEMGIEIKGTTYKDMAVIGMISAAMRGNVNAFEKLQELTNEKDANETAEIFAKLDEVLAKVGDD